MGNTCGCLSLTPNSGSQPAVAQPKTYRSCRSHRSHHTARSKVRFENIEPDKQSEERSEFNLKELAKDLDQFIVQYEIKNGVLTKRFTERPRTEANLQFPSQIERTKDIQENAPNEEANIQPEQMSDSCYNGQQATPQPKQGDKSCILTEVSCVLDPSIFTERLEAKKEFYLRHNTIGEVQLGQWQEVKRSVFEISDKDILQLRQNGKHQQLVLAAEAIQAYWYQNYVHLISVCPEPKGLRINYNGTKRLFPLQFPSQNGPSLLNIDSQILSNMPHVGLSELIYMLTGWISEQIHVQEVRGLRGIFERLQSNMNEGNTIVTLKRITEKGPQYVHLKSVVLEKDCIQISSYGTNLTVPGIMLEEQKPNGDIVLSLPNFAQLFDQININWNPYLYELRVAREGTLESPEIKNQRYSLVIPPSSQDIEIRLFVQQHMDQQDQHEHQVLLIELFEAEGHSQNGSNEAIRKITTTSQIFSDVFIFESCQEKTQYIITVSTQDEKELDGPVDFTFTLFSFAQISFKEMPDKVCSKSVQVTSKISQSNLGFGINSPHYNKNLQYSVEVSKGQELEVAVQASEQLVYEICLILDMEGKKRLTGLKLEHIINNSMISGEKNGPSQFKIKTQSEDYILVINSFTPAQQEINIKLNLFQSALIESGPVLNVEPSLPQRQTIFTSNIKWLPGHSGPRRRLKSNSTNEYQDISVFKDFFNNPVLDKQLPVGKYQFFVKSTTFCSLFDAIDCFEDKNLCQPPALSLGILKVAEGGQEFKIVQDDAFYVPFGVGFWSMEMQLQEGNYRFVCPKMEKTFSKGVFGIVKC